MLPNDSNTFIMNYMYLGLFLDFPIIHLPVTEA